MFGFFSVNFNFLFRYFHRNQTSESGANALHMSLFTLTKMAHGGIHDHISQVSECFHGCIEGNHNEVKIPNFQIQKYCRNVLLISYMQCTRNVFVRGQVNTYTGYHW